MFFYVRTATQFIWWGKSGCAVKVRVQVSYGVEWGQTLVKKFWLVVEVDTKAYIKSSNCSAFTGPCWNLGNRMPGQALVKPRSYVDVKKTQDLLLVALSDLHEFPCALLRFKNLSVSKVMLIASFSPLLLLLLLLYFSD